MERGRFYQQFGEQSGEAGSAKQLVTDLLQRQRLQVGDISQYYMSWLDVQSESAGYLPQPLAQTIRKVSLGLGFLFYHHWAQTDRPGRNMQAAFQKRLQRWQEHDQGQVVLTYEEGLLLRDAAAVVNVAYDPGGEEDTPENRGKRTFRFADLERRGVPADPTEVVEATKAVPDGK